MKVFFKTFGCRVNQYETEDVREKLMSDGVSTAVKDWSSADLCVLNTCTVTKEADRDALALARQISRRNPAARLVVTGCLATRDPQAVREAAPEALIVSNEEKSGIPSLIGCRAVPDEAGLRSFSEHSRAFLKIQDGCNMYCTYCIIPSVRPDLSSRRPEAIEAEVSGLVFNGYREIVLCGIRLGRYMAEDSFGRRVDFVRLLSRLMRLPGDFRIRLSSLEITDVTERFLSLYDESAGKLCPSFHLPIQSGCDKTLSRMKRWYSTEFYSRRMSALRKRLPEAGVFTDVMVGFPGETADDFETSKAFIRKMGFAGLHVFRYSARSQTPAYDWAPVPDAELLRRAKEMRSLDWDLRTAFASRSVGALRRVLIEERGDRTEGLTEHFLRVKLDASPGAGLHAVRIIASEGPQAHGEIYEKVLSESLRSAKNTEHTTIGA